MAERACKFICTRHLSCIYLEVQYRHNIYPEPFDQSGIDIIEIYSYLLLSTTEMRAAPSLFSNSGLILSLFLKIPDEGLRFNLELAYIDLLHHSIFFAEFDHLTFFYVSSIIFFPLSVHVPCMDGKRKKARLTNASFHRTMADRK